MTQSRDKTAEAQARAKKYSGDEERMLIPTDVKIPTGQSVNHDYAMIVKLATEHHFVSELWDEEPRHMRSTVKKGKLSTSAVADLKEKLQSQYPSQKTNDAEMGRKKSKKRPGTSKMETRLSESARGTTPGSTYTGAENESTRSSPDVEMADVSPDVPIDPSLVADSADVHAESDLEHRGKVQEQEKSTLEEDDKVSTTTELHEVMQEEEIIDSTEMAGPPPDDAEQSASSGSMSKSTLVSSNFSLAAQGGSETPLNGQRSSATPEAQFSPLKRKASPSTFDTPLLPHQDNEAAASSVTDAVNSGVRAWKKQKSVAVNGTPREWINVFQSLQSLPPGCHLIVNTNSADIDTSTGSPMLTERFKNSQRNSTGKICTAMDVQTSSYDARSHMRALLNDLRPACNNNSVVYEVDLSEAVLSLQSTNWVREDAIHNILNLFLDERQMFLDSSYLGRSEQSIKEWKNQLAEKSALPILPDVQQVIIPVARQAHWVVAVIDLHQGLVTYLDSAPGCVEKEDLLARLKHLASWLLQQSNRDRKDFKIEELDVLTQPNTYDCGIYMLVSCIHHLMKLKQPPEIKSNTWREIFIHCLSGKAPEPGQSHSLSNLLCFDAEESAQGAAPTSSYGEYKKFFADLDMMLHEFRNYGQIFQRALTRANSDQTVQKIIDEDSNLEKLNRMKELWKPKTTDIEETEALDKSSKKSIDLDQAITDEITSTRNRLKYYRTRQRHRESTKTRLERGHGYIQTVDKILREQLLTVLDLTISSHEKDLELLKEKKRAFQVED